jgi:hypothetical protein
MTGVMGGQNVPHLFFFGSDDLRIAGDWTEKLTSPPHGHLNVRSVVCTFESILSPLNRVSSHHGYRFLKSVFSVSGMPSKGSSNGQPLTRSAH